MAPRTPMPGFENMRFQFPSRTSHRSRPSVLIVGAGPTGLSAAYHLGADAEVVDRNPTVGGRCRSVHEDGFTFDYADNALTGEEPGSSAMVRRLLDDNLHWQDRKAAIYSHGAYVRAPFHEGLRALPEDVVHECLRGAIDARRARSRGRNGTNGAAAAREPEHLQAFIEQAWGPGVARHFALPLQSKLWKVPLDGLEASWPGGQAPPPNLAALLGGALAAGAGTAEIASRFGYPVEGGFQAVMDGFVPLLARRPRLSTALKAIALDEHVATLSDGTLFEYDALVSTMPLPELVRLAGARAPERIHRAAAGLRHVSLRRVHVGIGREDLTDRHVIEFPTEAIFHRAIASGNQSPANQPRGCSALTFEITHHPGAPLPADGLPLVRRCIEDAQKVGLIRRDDPIRVALQTDLPCALAIPDRDRASRVGEIRQWFADQDVFLAGPAGEWTSADCERALAAGREVACEVKGAGRTLELPLAPAWHEAPQPEYAGVGAAVEWTGT